jgi:hypothetical protein
MSLPPPPAAPGGLGSGNRIPITAAVWNATGLGAGYIYLRGHWYAVGSWPVTGLLLWLSTGPAQPATGWRLALGGWLIAMTCHGWLLGRSRARRQPPATATAGSRRWRPLAAALLALAVLAAGLGYLRLDTYRIHRAASDHHATGDCGAAVAQLDRLSRLHRLPSGRATAAATRERAACQRLLAARQAAAAGEPGEALAILDDYLGRPDAAWAGPARGWRAELLFAHGSQLLAAGLAGLDGKLALALRRFDELLADHPDSPEAGQVEEAIAPVSRDLASEVADGDACTADELVAFLVRLPRNDGLVGRVSAEAADLQPRLLLACGDQLRDGDRREAAGWYDRLMDSYPDHELAAEAQDRLDEIEVQDEIDLINKGDPERLLVPAEGGAARGGVVLVLGNGSDQELELLYTGPETDRVHIPAGGGDCQGGTGETVTIRLPAGSYQVAVRATGGGVPPVAGTWQLRSGVRYLDCYFIGPA